MMRAPFLLKRCCQGLAAWLLLCASAQAQTVCGSPFVSNPTVAPVLPSASFPQSDAAVDCFMWQTFVYLTWPALAGSPGQPNPQATYGSSGASVWETFRPYDTVFLPKGAAPTGWGSAQTAHQQRLNAWSAAWGTKKSANKQGADARASLSSSVPPSVRLLNNVSKKFRALSPAETTLTETNQAGGGVLYDQAGMPVYYEMLLNETEFNYIVQNTLYEATAQNAFAKATGIVLPTGSVEVKAAWKVLNAQELAAKPVRFHTAQALLPQQSKPVTVGLVGLHVMTMPSNSSFSQGFWATFAQVDNAPLSSTSTQAYSFFNPQCQPAPCPVNQKTKAGQPTQVVQVFGATPEAQAINQWMVQQIQNNNASSPWQFYQLLDVQWPNSSVPINKPAQGVPLPNGSPNTNTLMNPVLETFLQQSNVSCLGCHTYGSTASTGAGSTSYASGYSFLFGHAQVKGVGAGRRKP